MNDASAPTSAVGSPASGRDAGDAARVDRALRRSRTIARLLDTAYRVPGTGIRFGYDAIVGLVPVVGDTITTVIGFYPVVEAVRLGVAKRTVLRMLLNLAIDWLVGLVPVADIVFDVAYKANVRNVRLLEKALRRRLPPA